MNLLFTPTEHRHAEHEVIMSGAANACPICQAAEIANLKARLTQLESANMALLETIKNLPSVKFQCPLCGLRAEMTLDASSVLERKDKP